MGLFKKDSPAEKKLKELTGSFILSTFFIDKLRNNGLTINDGVKIRNKLKNEIKEGKLLENEVEDRLNQLINPQDNDPSSKKKCSKCGKIQNFENIFCINCGFEFSKEIECPNCKHHQSNTNTTCSDCGYDFETGEMPSLLKTCPECNLLQKAGNMYCRNCKHDLRDVDYEPSHDLIKCSHCERMIPKNKSMCPFCKYDFDAEKKEKIKKEKLKTLNLINHKNKIAFLHNYDFNLKECPDCNTKFLKVDSFCFNCGASMTEKETIINDNTDVRNDEIVEKIENNQKNELDDLKVLYNQTIQSKYSPTFRVAYVLFLDAFRKNPSKKFSEKIAKKYETTPNKLKKQALKDEFIEPAPPISEAKNFKVSELKDILKEHDLKVSGKKDELIERLGENLSEDELKKHFKSKNYQISSKGEEFLAKNSYVLYITGDSDISKAFKPSEIGKIFEEKEYSADEIYEKLLAYFKRILNEKVTQKMWGDFKTYSNAIAQVQEDKGDLNDALNTRFKVFLFNINNYSIILNKPDPGRTKLKQKDMTKLVGLMHEMTLPIDELKALFENAFNEVLFKTIITVPDSLVYLLKVFGGEDLNSVSNEISMNYSTPR